MIINQEDKKCFIEAYDSFMEETRAYSSPSWQTPRGKTFFNCVERVYELNPPLGIKQLNGGINRIKTGRRMAEEKGDIQYARFERNFLEKDARGLGYNLSIVEKNQEEKYYIVNKAGKKILTNLGKKMLMIHGNSGLGTRKRGQQLFKRDKELEETPVEENSSIPEKPKPKKPKTLNETLTQGLKKLTGDGYVTTPEDERPVIYSSNHPYNLK
tara:strand:+ start:662 stop:1300 length:639 start_codon:yes stop_codon:yes gene_type:complete